MMWDGETWPPMKALTDGERHEFDEIDEILRNLNIAVKAPLWNGTDMPDCRTTTEGWLVLRWITLQARLQK